MASDTGKIYISEKSSYAKANVNEVKNLRKSIALALGLCSVPVNTGNSRQETTAVGFMRFIAIPFIKRSRNNDPNMNEAIYDALFTKAKSEFSLSLFSSPQQPKESYPKSWISPPNGQVVIDDEFSYIMLLYVFAMLYEGYGDQLDALRRLIVTTIPVNDKNGPMNVLGQSWTLINEKKFDSNTAPACLIAAVNFVNSYDKNFFALINDIRSEQNAAKACQKLTALLIMCDLNKSSDAMFKSMATENNLNMLSSSFVSGNEESAQSFVFKLFTLDTQQNVQ